MGSVETRLSGQTCAGGLSGLAWRTSRRVSDPGAWGVCGLAAPELESLPSGQAVPQQCGFELSAQAFREAPTLSGDAAHERAPWRPLSWLSARGGSGTRLTSGGRQGQWTAEAGLPGTSWAPGTRKPLGSFLLRPGTEGVCRRPGPVKRSPQVGGLKTTRIHSLTVQHPSEAPQDRGAPLDKCSQVA